MAWLTFVKPYSQYEALTLQKAGSLRAHMNLFGFMLYHGLSIHVQPPERSTDMISKAVASLLALISTKDPALTQTIGAKFQLPDS